MPKVLFILLVLVAACAPRAKIDLMPDAEQVGHVVPVFYSTTRDPGDFDKFGNQRDYAPTLGRLDVSVPKDHVIGKIETARAIPDPAKDFVASAEASYERRRDFRAALAAALAKRPRGRREVVIYVHGFNNTFAEGVYRTAQLVNDFKIDAVAVHYSWPSLAHPLGYAYDRDSALFARDGLEALISDVDASGAEVVLIVGHSMGALLTMEAIRQIAIVSPARLHRAVDAVVLISPDIDIQVFRSQVARIGKLPSPFVIFVSRRDRALALSARLTGQANRLGNVQSINDVADLDVTVMDVTNFTSRLDLGHFTVGSSAALIRIFESLPALDAVLRGDRAGRIGLISGTVLTAQNATEIILSPITGLPQQQP